MSARVDTTQGASTSGLTGFIAVDLGSSSGRVMLGVVSPEGGGRCTLQQVHRFANVPLRSEVRGLEALAWDVRGLFDETLEGIARSVAIAGERGIPIAGIGVDSWGVDYGLIDRNGDLLPPVKHHRSADPAMPARSALLVDPARAYRVTGVLDQAINTSHQLRQDGAAGLATVAETMLLTPDLWVYWLSGRVAGERTIASTTQLLDRDTGQWSRELMDAWGIKIMLPPLVDDGEFAGLTVPHVTKRIGALRPLPVFYVASHDTASAFAAAVEARSAGNETVTGIVSCGSWAVTGVATERAVLTEEARLLGFTQELGADGATLLVRNLSGMWLLQECVRAWSEEDGASVDILALIEEAWQVDHPAVIDVADEEFQRPGNLPERLAARCAAFGPSRPLSRAEMVRVIIRSLALAYAETLREAARLVGAELGEVRIIGGGARNRLLCQLTANEVGLVVESGLAEASSLGIVYRLAVASRTLPDMNVARALTLVDDDAIGRFMPHTPTRKATE